MGICFTLDNVQNTNLIDANPFYSLLVCFQGLRFSGVNETDYRVYLLGNPVSWSGRFQANVFSKL